MNTNVRPFFSIIIPVYNGSCHFLRDCLDSIWNQPLGESLYEVICVDDHSSDDTRVWLLAESKRHSNLKLFFNEQNIRQGGSRNNGVKMAEGKYILFIDQDDYYHKGALRKVYEHLLDTDVDVLVNDSAYQFRSHESNTKQLNYPSMDIMDWETFAKTNYIAISPWRLTINLEFYLAHDNSFMENCRIEDIDWGVRLMYYAKRVQYFPHILIHYNKAESGTTDNMHKNRMILLDNTKAGLRVYEIANTLYTRSSIKKMIINIACNTFAFSIKYMFGLWTSISKKREIIDIIPNIPENGSLVNIAKRHPTFFCAISNLSVPAFRIVRYMHRYRMARLFAK